MTFLEGRGAAGKRRTLFVLGRLLGLFGAVVLLAFAGWAFWLWSYAVSPGPLVEGASLHVSIPPKTSFFGIQKILVEKGVIRPDRRFFHLARYHDLTQRLKAGEYLFRAGQTHYEVLLALASGSSVRWPLTIPEGASIYQIADLLAAGGWGEREQILALVRDQELLEKYGAQGDSLEGYLFPDTYHLARGQGVAEIIGMMAERGRQVRGQLGDLADNPFGLTSHEVLTLASIVEKETALPAERPLIARVFLNRLQKRMRLQTDPTVIYGLTDFDGNLTRKNLRQPTPYNTYVIKGLPPGPIANPGREAIEAVLRPAEGNYLYFVSKNDGSHYFSATLAEHNRAVYKFQKSGKSRQAGK
ncbi:endolytic transglycosylase MltG [Thiovibrio sp. JS02]